MSTAAPQPGKGPETERLYRALLARPASSREPAVERERRFQDPELCARLIAESEDEVFDNPSEALGLARLADAVSQHLGPSPDGRRDLDLRLLATLGVANALRVIGNDLVEAERRLHRAEELLVRLGEPSELTARVLHHKASLRTDQRRFDEALDLAARAAALSRRSGHRGEEAKSVVQQGYILLLTETRPAAALRTLRRAIPLLDPRQDPRLFVICMHNLIIGLDQLGYTIAARSLLADVETLHRRLGDEMNLLRFRWLEARLDLEIGKTEAAEQGFLAVRDAFAERDLPYHAALVSLDLAELYLGQSRAYKLRQLAAEMLPVFQSRRIHREALAALIVFREAVAVEAAGVELVRQVAEFLDKARRNPELRFQP